MKHQQDDSAFLHHFNILDSVVNLYSGDSVYACCTASIKFMEENTGIYAHSDGTFFGKLAFSKKDLEQWHEWYNSNNR